MVAAIDEAHLERQIAFSLATFGPGARPFGVIDHIQKELGEVLAAYANGEDALPEWVDVIILALDGAWRCGHTPAEVIAAIKEKQERNEARTWPDWRTADPDKAIEHDRTMDAPGELVIPVYDPAIHDSPAYLMVTCSRCELRYQCTPAMDFYTPSDQLDWDKGGVCESCLLALPRRVRN